jgi:hypothetical protein
MDYLFVGSIFILRFILSQWHSTMDVDEFCQSIKQKLLSQPTAVVISGAFMLLINNQNRGFLVVIFLIFWWNIELLCEKGICSRIDRALRIVGCGLFGFLIAYTDFSGRTLLLQIANGANSGVFQSSTVAFGISLVMCATVEHLNIFGKPR